MVLEEEVVGSAKHFALVHGTTSEAVRFLEECCICWRCLILQDLVVMVFYQRAALDALV
jgi:hypothetical protein